MLKRIISLVNRIVPKTDIILFNSFPFYSDNARFVYQYIVKNRHDITSKYRLYWMVDDIQPESDSEEFKDLRVVRKKSIRGLWLFLRARYIFATHGYFKYVQSPSTQTNVNLWHGCGYKDNSDSDCGYRGNYTVVVGDVYVPIHARIFDLDKQYVLVTGFPRNDALFNKTSNLQKLGINDTGYHKTIIWLPTYRKASIGYDQIDGDPDDFGFRTLLSEAEFYNEILQKNNLFLIIKPHPMEEKLIHTDNKAFSNIKMLTNSDLSARGLTLYDILNETDVLLSDYSSVAVDYLLTDSDLAFVVGDFEAYMSNRGFVFDNVSEMMPGPLIENKTSFIDYLTNIDSYCEKYKDKRDRVKATLHKYTDNRSTQRVVEYFFGDSVG